MHRTNFVESSAAWSWPADTWAVAARNSIQRPRNAQRSAAELPLAGNMQVVVSGIEPRARVVANALVLENMAGQ